MFISIVAPNMKCANCNIKLEDGLLPGTCCSKQCSDELLADIDSTHEDDLMEDKNWEHEQDYALEMEGQPINNSDE